MHQSNALPNHRCSRKDIDWQTEQYASFRGHRQLAAFDYLVGRCPHCQRVHLCVPVDLDLAAAKKHRAWLRAEIAESWLGKGTHASNVRVWPGTWGTDGNH
jgi:hypothetical protein